MSYFSLESLNKLASFPEHLDYYRLSYILESELHASTPSTANSSKPATAFCCVGLMLLSISYNLLLPKP